MRRIHPAEEGSTVARLWHTLAMGHSRETIHAWESADPAIGRSIGSISYIRWEEAPAFRCRIPARVLH